MIAFIGSFRFAIILIALSATLVIAGTVLESRSDSHGVAEEWIYHNPIFQLLLGGYFINILFSTLSRRPFKKHHIPFIITHIGLLMIISGVFIKSRAGIQGHLQLIEGTVTDDLVQPGTRALLVRQKFPEKVLSIPEEELTVKDYFPHAEEHLFGWIKDDALHLRGVSPMPIREEPYSLDVGEEEPLNVYLKEPRAKMEDPYVLIKEGEDGAVTLSTRESTLAFSPKNLESYVAYDQGFGGYGLQALLPFASTRELAKDLNLHLASGKPFSPPLELIRNSIQDLDFGTIVIHYLKEWADEESFLSSVPFLSPLNWESVPQNIQNALFWIGELFEEEDFIEHLRKNKWPLMAELENEDKATLRELWMAQMWALRDDLPPAPQPPSSKMLSAYLRLYGIHLSTIPFKTITLETPLFRRIEEKAPPIKREDREPLALFEFEGQIFPLVYDTKGSRLKTPAGGNFLLNYQPHRIKLPYFVRLHEASDIKYPDSEQTASYECSLTLISKKTGEATICALQMNQVYETPDGYRFYLAGMGPIDPYSVRTVQLVVNRDPAKWILTYPGALLLSLGMILLFWKNKFLSFFN
jgi:hypothetical protein